MDQTEKIILPKGFLLGAATAAHQIEGNNVNSDWWAWEHSEKRINYLKKRGLNPEDFMSGQACDSYNRYEEDFTLAQSLGHNAHRLSIEWARIEPGEGKFSEKEFEHYEEVFKSAKAHKLTLFVTLHHFTNPLWFAQKGGFEKKENIKYFVRYCQVAAQRLGQHVDFWLTINEPEGYAAGGFLTGVWPPQKKNILTAFRVARNLSLAHNQTAPVLRKASGKPVGMAYDIVDLQPTGHIARLLMRFFYNHFNKFVFYRTIRSCDFIGVNYYFHHHLGFWGKRRHSHSQHLTSDIGWGIHPEGIERVLMHMKKYRKPIYITENGIADAKDLKREAFIRRHLYYICRAIQKGCDVRGYLHWSLLDNFEWEKDFAPRFGLIGVNYKTFERKVRPSAWVYKELIG